MSWKRNGVRDELLRESYRPSCLIILVPEHYVVKGRQILLKTATDRVWGWIEILRDGVYPCDHDLHSSTTNNRYEDSSLLTYIRVIL